MDSERRHFCTCLMAAAVGVSSAASAVYADQNPSIGGAEDTNRADAALGGVFNYRSVFIPAYLRAKQELHLVIRAFNDQEGRALFLVVNSATLETTLMPSTELQFRKPLADGAGYIHAAEIRATRYIQTLEKHTGAPFVLENQGLQAADPLVVAGAFMTVDLCPSTRPFEQVFFTRLGDLSRVSGQPIPVAISISGLWLLKYQSMFDWLVTQDREHKLSITWINHSYTHLYYPDVPTGQNFLLATDANPESEFLELERLLIAHGEVPSVFVRMPGLVSDERVILQARKLGLIPVGTNAWLARDQAVTSGSIVLVHGNGNEPQGIELALPLLSHWQWLDIKDAV